MNDEVVNPALRFAVLARDNHTCRYCGRTPPEVVLHVDHIMPRSLGGRRAPENLITACAECNQGKSSMPPGIGSLIAKPIQRGKAKDKIDWVNTTNEGRKEYLRRAIGGHLGRGATFDEAVQKVMQKLGYDDVSISETISSLLGHLFEETK